MAMNRILAASVLLLCAVASAQQVSLPPHPRLLFNTQGVQELKQRIQQAPWARDTFNRIKSGMDKTIDRPVELPLRGGNWAHWYICPTHHCKLSRGKQIDPWHWEHVCSSGKEILRGDEKDPSRDFDGCVISNIHGSFARQIRDMGMVYQVSGDSRYALRAREILLAYADRYLSYPLHTTRGQKKIGGGRVGPQTLDEAMWLIPVAQGADLIWTTLSDADRKTLADKLFLPAARDVILAHKMGIHNIQNWKNSAVGLTGFLLGNDDLIHSAIDDTSSGYREQMGKGVQGDGVWWEGAWGYHFFTLSAVWPLTEAARNCGIDLYCQPLRKMFDSPITLGMPNFVLPAFNDSGEMGVPRSIYELAYARYKDPVMLRALASSNRRDEDALFFGLPEIPATQPADAPASQNDTFSGYGILRQGQGEQSTWLCVKYGPHGGGHGHPDKNTFILYTRKQTVVSDPGTRLYGSPMHGGWDKVTIAHNTLTVDQTDQSPAQGKCLGFGSDHGVDYAITDAGPIYKGVRFIRTATLLNENLVVFVDRIQSDKPHTFDMSCYHKGKWQDLPAGDPITLPDRPGYKYLTDITRRSTTDGLALAVELDKDHRSVITLASHEPTEIITFTGPGKSISDRVPGVLFRRQAQNTTYVWAISLDGATPRLSSTEDGPVVRVEIQAGQRQWNLQVNPEAGTLSAATK